MTDAPDGRALPLRLGAAWLAIVLPLGLLATLYLAGQPPGTITTYYLMNQDLGPLLAASLFMLLICLPSVRLDARRAEWIAGLAERRGWAFCLAAALATGAVAFAGWWLVYQTYPLSMDEFWVTFDARIFSRGKLLAEIAPAWRAYAPALQPWWPIQTPGHEYWASPYLPMNAAFRAVFGALGSPALAGPFWAALSIVTVYAIARELWPGRRDAAWVAAALLATSSQLLVTAMGPYAMSAHLALNLIWLWLFLRKGAWWRALGVVVAFTATGLHQAIFHPLFAAPFVLQLWLSRRWRLAGFYTAVYAAICLFWVSYWALMLPSQGLAPAAAEVHGAGEFARRALAMVASPDPAGPGLMVLNLLRFVAWQNPLAVTLGALGAVYAVRARDPVLAPLAAGMALTVAAMSILLPFQSYGWGYRYLHGLLGSQCLLAALAWVRLAAPGEESARRAWAALGAMAAFCLFLMLPSLGWKVAEFIGPFARSHAAIEHAPADVVIVDTKGLWYGSDLVRNDPFLERGPKVMHLKYLTPTEVRALCTHYRVALFDYADGATLGLPTYSAAPPTDAKVALMRSLSCGDHVVRGAGPGLR